MPARFCCAPIETATRVQPVEAFWGRRMKIPKRAQSSAKARQMSMLVWNCAIGCLRVSSPIVSRMANFWPAKTMEAATDPMAMAAMT